MATEATPAARVGPFETDKPKRAFRLGDRVRFVYGPDVVRTVAGYAWTGEFWVYFVTGTCGRLDPFPRSGGPTTCVPKGFSHGETSFGVPKGADWHGCEEILLDGDFPRCPACKQPNACAQEGLCPSCED